MLCFRADRRLVIVKSGLEAVRKLPQRPLSSLEKKVGDDEPDVFSRLCDYIDAHAKELQEHGDGAEPIYGHSCQ